MTPPVLETDRLVLRPFAPDDVEQLHTLFTDAAVRRWLLDDELVAREWVELEITASAARFATGASGLWALCERPSSEIVGFVGFRPFFTPPEVQLVYGLLPSRWGRGLATEAAAAAVAHAFDVLGLREVRAATDIPNEASIAVLARLGFEEWRRTDEGTAGTVHFRLDIETWRERRTGARPLTTRR